MKIQLPVSFNSTSLPKLPPADGVSLYGGIYLFDAINVESYASQANPIPASSRVNSLLDMNWPGGVNTVFTYDPETGLVSGSDDGNNLLGISVESSEYQLFNDATHDYGVSVWGYFGTRDDGAASNPLFEKGNGNTALNTHGLIIRFQPGSERIARMQPATTDSSAQSGSNYKSYAYTPGNHRFATAWYKSGGTWKFRDCLDQAVQGEQTSAFGSGTDGIQNSRSWTAKMFGAAGGSGDPLTGSGLYRFYVEDLTLSGRTAAEFFNADWRAYQLRFN